MPAVAARATRTWLVATWRVALSPTICRYLPLSPLLTTWRVARAQVGWLRSARHTISSPEHAMHEESGTHASSCAEDAAFASTTGAMAARLSREKRRGAKIAERDAVASGCGGRDLLAELDPDLDIPLPHSPRVP